MFRISFDPVWHVRRTDTEGDTQETRQLLRLLAGIENSGSIAAASRDLRLSYRHAWGLLRDAEAMFGGEILEKQPGRGTRLSALGRVLLRADERVRARLTPTLETLASELEAELRRELATERMPVRLFASHGFAVETLVETLGAAETAVELSYRNGMEALAALARRECDLAGFHVPVGRFEAEAAARSMRWLNPATHVLVHLTVRTQGLLLAAGNPKRVRGLRDLADGRIRFVNRQPGSGTRMLLEQMLQTEGLDCQRIRGFDSSEFTHAAVAAYVSSGMADAGFGVEAAARRFGLDFIPLARERYFFAAERAALERGPCATVLDILRSPAFRQRVAALPGYDSVATGQVMEIEEAFPGGRR